MKTIIEKIFHALFWWALTFSLSVSALAEMVKSGDAAALAPVRPWWFDVLIATLSIFFGWLLTVVWREYSGRVWMMIVYSYRSMVVFFNKKHGLMSVQTQFRVSNIDATGGWCVIIEAVGFKNHEVARCFAQEIIAIIRQEKNEGLLFESQISDITPKISFVAIRVDGISSEKEGMDRIDLVKKEMDKRYGKGKIYREVRFSPGRKIP